MSQPYLREHASSGGLRSPGDVAVMGGPGGPVGQRTNTPKLVLGGLINEYAYAA